MGVHRSASTPSPCSATDACSSVQPVKLPQRATAMKGASACAHHGCVQPCRVCQYFAARMHVRVAHDPHCAQLSRNTHQMLLLPGQTRTGRYHRAPPRQPEETTHVQETLRYKQRTAQQVIIHGNPEPTHQMFAYTAIPSQQHTSTAMHNKQARPCKVTANFAGIVRTHMPQAGQYYSAEL